MKKFIIMAAMALLGLNAQAQIVSSRSATTTRMVIEETKTYTGWSTLGVEYLPSNISADGHSESFSGFAFNYTNAISLTQSIPLFLEWGVGAQYSTYSLDDTDIRWASIKAPVNLIYDFQIPNTRINIDPYLGVKFRGNVWGEIKEEHRGNKESYDLFDEGKCKRFQAGMQIGVKARFNDAFFVGVGYGFDFNDFGESAKINELNLSLGLVL